MRHFMSLGLEDIWHLEACLSAAKNSARKILDLPAPVTEDQIRKHKDVELEFDIQLTHIRQYLNETWTEDEATEHDGPPEAIDEVGEGPRRVRMPLVIVGPAAKSSFKINEGTAWTLKYLAQGIIGEADDYIDDPEINGSDCLDQMALAFFAFLRAIKKEDPAEG